MSSKVRNTENCRASGACFQIETRGRSKDVSGTKVGMRKPTCCQCCSQTRARSCMWSLNAPSVEGCLLRALGACRQRQQTLGSRARTLERAGLALRGRPALQVLGRAAHHLRHAVLVLPAAPRPCAPLSALPGPGSCNPCGANHRSLHVGAVDVRGGAGSAGRPGGCAGAVQHRMPPQQRCTMHYSHCPDAAEPRGSGLRAARLQNRA